MYFLRLCWKNVWRNKRRTLLTVNAIAVGVMALVSIHNYYDSFHEQIIDNVIRYQSGHLLLSAQGFQKNHSPQNFLQKENDLSSWFKRDTRVIASSPRIIAPGLVSSPKGSANIAFVGIEPSTERGITRYYSNIVEGTYFEGVIHRPIVIGRLLAEALSVGIGSKIVALTQGVDGSIGNELFFVSGIFETHSESDKALAFIAINDARKLLSMPDDSFHQMSVLLKTESEGPLVQSSFRTEWPDPALQLLSWRDIQKHVVAIIDLDRAVNKLLLGVILLVAALGITNTILMSIMERSREFGVMMAIGTQTRELVGMIVGETLLLCGVGVVFGNVLAIGVTSFFHRTGFDLKWLTSHDFAIDGTLVKTICYPAINLFNSLSVSLAVLAISIVVAAIPIRFITRLKPVVALRSH